jgi:hypothetical protein
MKGKMCRSALDVYRAVRAHDKLIDCLVVVGRVGEARRTIHSLLCHEHGYTLAKREPSVTAVTDDADAAVAAAEKGASTVTAVTVALAAATTDDSVGDVAVADAAAAAAENDDEDDDGDDDDDDDESDEDMKVDLSASSVIYDVIAPINAEPSPSRSAEAALLCTLGRITQVRI